jgi:hypothetical protein
LRCAKAVDPGGDQSRSRSGDYQVATANVDVGPIGAVSHSALLGDGLQGRPTLNGCRLICN